MALISSSVATVHIVGSILITIFGAAGCSAPLGVTFLARPQPKIMRYLSFVQLALTALGAGVVINTALVHILPDGMDMLSQGGLDDSVATTALHNLPLLCRSYLVDNNNTNINGTTAAPHAPLSMRDVEDDFRKPYPYGPMLMMVGMLVTYVIDSELHKLADAQEEATMKAHVTELGIAVHSVLVGVAYGAMTSLDSLNTLAVALTIHQLCEGFAMGPLIYKGARSTLHAVILVAIFALSTPLGIGIGALALQYGDPGSKQANLSQGILSCLAAGMLMYVGAVEFLGGLQRATDDPHGGGAKPIHNPILEGGNHYEYELSDQLIQPESTIVSSGSLTPVTTAEDCDGTVQPPHTFRVDGGAGGPHPCFEATFLTDYPFVSRVASHTMVLLGAALMAVVAIYI